MGVPVLNVPALKQSTQVVQYAKGATPSGTRQAKQAFDNWYNKTLDDVKKVQNARDSIQRVQNRIKNSRIFGKHEKKNNTTVSSGNSASSPSNSSSSWDSRYNNVLNNLTQEQQYYLDSKGINFQTASGLQEGLNKNFNSGLAVDNKWGNKSQAALDKILAEMPQMSKEDNEKYRPSATGVINQNDQYVPNNQQQVQTSPFAGINNPNPVQLNRTDIRSILSHYGYNPYSFTGGQRKALRQYLGGDRNQDISFIEKNSQMYKDWIAPFVTFQKKGGQLISNNPVERFKVKKGQNGFQITYKPLVAANSFFDDSKKKLKSEIESKMSEAQARNDRLESSHRKANKNNLAPRKANNTAYLQDQLYNIGAFGNIKYEKAIDGIKGKLTSNAIKKAKEMGYTIDEQAGKISKGSSINVASSNNVTSNNNVSKSQEVANKLVQGLREVEQDRQRQILNAREIARVNDLSGGRFYENSLRYLDDPHLYDKPTPITSSINSMYDRMYPYSYGDMIIHNGDTVAYKGQEIPEGAILKQITANVPKELQKEALKGKIRFAVNGIDPRKKFMEEYANMDLNDPSNIEKINNRPKGMIRVSASPNDQFEVRARLDAMDHYANRKQKYNTWEVNPDFSSPTALSRGQATYRIADPQQRERLYAEMTNWFLRNKNKGHWSEDGKAWIVPSMGFMGNHALVADDQNGLNLRYGDYWDYAVNSPGGTYMYMGDRLVPRGTYPKYNSKYGTGHNSDSESEATDELFKNKFDFLKEMLF